jgi:hypothetical protein
MHMSSLLKKTLAKLSQHAAKAAGSTAAKSVDSVRRGAVSGAEGARQAVEVARHSKHGRQAAEVARVAAASGPVKQVAYLCGRAGVAGAIVDGAVGGLNAAKYMRAGKIDGTQATVHVCAEAGCGFVTSSSGTAGTIIVYMLTGSMGPAAMAVGMGASIGSRYAYRRIVGETLPDDDNAEHEEDAVEESDVIEEIGPRPQDD